MEESQIPSLPAEYAAEAQNLRREIESRNRAMMQERFFNQHHGALGNASYLSSILRSTAAVAAAGTRHSHHILSRDTWRTHHFGRATNQGLGGHASAAAAAGLGGSAAFLRFRGRQLLDHEGLSCLLILLFIDDSKINTTRLHRILRNLCYHGPTRDWVVRSLLSILDKSNNTPTKTVTGMEAGKSSSSLDTPPVKVSRKSSSGKAVEAKSAAAAQLQLQQQQQQPSWLNISLDAALGFRANV